MLTQFFAAPGVIDLAWGHPDPELLPAGLVAEAAVAALDALRPRCLGYGASAGPPPLIDWLTRPPGVASTGVRRVPES